MEFLRGPGRTPLFQNDMENQSRKKEIKKEALQGYI
jgi:hypothetical protein